MKKSSEAAWKVVNEHRELFDSISKEFAVEIIAAVIQEQVREALEEAAITSKQAHYDYCGKTNLYPCEELAEFQAQAIRELKERIE